MLAAWIKHGDSKSSNQRLVCLKGGVDKSTGKCTKPLIMIQDGGATFGAGFGFIDELFGFIPPTAKARLQGPGWMDTPVWNNPKTCQAKLDTPFTLKDPVVTDAGRQLFYARLSQLSRDQVRAIVSTSRVAERGEEIKLDTPRPGQCDDGFTLRDDKCVRTVDVDDWVAIWMQKVDELIHPRDTKGNRLNTLCGQTVQY
jgi:hypothetical protein